MLSLCSSLITVVDNRGSRVVQFSHLSVKEFLVSDHLSSSTGYLIRYHILPGPAHTILAQVCLGLLLHLDDGSDHESVKDSLWSIMRLGIGSRTRNLRTSPHAWRLG